MYVSIFYSQSRSNRKVGFWIFNGGLHLESFLRTQNFPQSPLLLFNRGSLLNSPGGSWDKYACFTTIASIDRADTMMMYINI